MVDRLGTEGRRDNRTKLREMRSVGSATLITCIALLAPTDRIRRGMVCSIIKKLIWHNEVYVKVMKIVRFDRLICHYIYSDPIISVIFSCTYVE